MHKGANAFQDLRKPKDDLPLPLLIKEGIYNSPLYKGRYRGVLINIGIFHLNP